MSEKFGCNSVDNNADGLSVEILVQAAVRGRKELTAY